MFNFPASLTTAVLMVAEFDFHPLRAPFRLLCERTWQFRK
jgi:hypothetical protein